MTTEIPTTALTIADIAPTPVEMTSGSSPVEVDFGPRLYRITTGGTGAFEDVVLPAAPVLIGGFANDRLIGLRISFSLETQTNASDKVRITSAGGSIIGVSVMGLSVPSMDSVALSFEGATASFVWSLDGWALDAGASHNNLDYITAVGAETALVGQTQSDDNGGRVLIQGANAIGAGNGGDVVINNSQAFGSGNPGNLIIGYLPTADPHVPDAIWNNGGVLTVSAG